MRILLVTRYMPPLDSIATHRMYTFAKELSEAGHEVTALTTTKTGQIVTPWNFDTSMFDLIEIPYFDPFSFLSKKTVVEAKPRGLLSTLKNLYTNRFGERIPSRTDLWTFSAKRFLKKSGKKFDLVISSYAPPSAHLVGYYAKKTFGIPWIADYRDLWLENPVAKGMWPFTLLERWLEKRIMQKADLITTISEGHSEILQKKFPHCPHDVIMNGFSPDLLNKASSHYFQNSPKKVRIVYTGSLYSSIHSPLPLFQAIKTIGKDHFEVLFYGRVPHDVEEMIENEKLQNTVYIKGIVPLEESHSIQASADFLLYMQSPNPTVKGVFSGKLFEYLYSPTPILAIGSAPDYCPNRLIEETNAGYNCGTDQEKILSTLQLALNNQHKLKKNREQILTYTRKNQTKKLLDHVATIGCH